VEAWIGMLHSLTPKIETDKQPYGAIHKLDTMLFANNWHVLQFY